MARRVSDYRRTIFHGNPKNLPVLCFRSSELPAELAGAEPVSVPYCSEPIFAFLPVSRLRRALWSGQRINSEAFIAKLLIRAKQTGGIRLFRYDYGRILGRLFLSYLPLSFFQEAGFNCDGIRYHWFLDCSSMPIEEKGKLLVLAHAGMFAPLYHLNVHPESEREEFMQVMLNQRETIVFNPVVSDFRPELLWVWLPIYELSKHIDAYPDELVRWAAKLFQRNHRHFDYKWSMKLATKSMTFYANKVKQIVDSKVESGGLALVAEAV